MLSHNMEVVPKEQVVHSMDRASKRVLDRQQRVVNLRVVVVVVVVVAAIVVVMLAAAVVIGNALAMASPRSLNTPLAARRLGRSPRATPPP